MNYLLAFVAFLITSSSFAQVDRSIGMEQYRTTTQKNKEKVDPITQAVQFFTKQLSLDVFQEAAVKTELVANQKSIEDINNSRTMSFEEKKEKLKIINEDFKSKLKPLLSTEQFEKLENLEKNTQQKTENSKKKRKKSKKESSSEN